MKTDILKQYASLKRSLETEADRIKSRLQEIDVALGVEIPPPFIPSEVQVEATSKTGPGRPKGTKGGMSAAGRAAIVAAQKARWAKKNEQKGFTAPQLTVVTKLVEPSEPAKKRRYTPEGKARIVAGIKARWAKYNAAKGLTVAAESEAKPSRQVSAAVRKARSLVAKARWAKAKAAGKSRL